MRTSLRKLRHLLFPRPEFKIKAKANDLQWLGTDYGGFYFDLSRIGAEDTILSFGVGMDVSFDLNLIEKTGCKVCGFDPTPKSIQWIKEQNLPTNYSFYDYGVALETGVVRFFLPKNENHVSGSLSQLKNVNTNDTVEVPVKNIQDILLDLPSKKITAIKMDIEGTEYEVMPQIVSALPDLQQIAVEIHERFAEGGVSKTKSMVETLEENGFFLAAISDTLEELTFLRGN